MPVVRLRGGGNLGATIPAGGPWLPHRSAGSDGGRVQRLYTSSNGVGHSGVSAGVSAGVSSFRRLGTSLTLALCRAPLNTIF